MDIANNLSLVFAFLVKAVTYAMFLGLVVGIVSLFANHLKH